MNALADGGVTIHDMDVIGAGTLFQAATRHGPAGAEADRPDGHSRLQRVQRLRHRRDGDPHRLPVDQGRRGRHGSRRRRGADGQDGTARRRRTKKESNVYEPEGRYGAVTGVDGYLGTEGMPGVFAQAGMEYANEYDGVGFEQFAKVAYKNHLHSTLNPLAQYRKEFSMEEIMGAPTMSYPNTLLMCCPTGDGAAAAVLVSGERLKSMPKKVQKRAVKIRASVLTSDPYTESAQVQPDVNTLTRNAAAQAYETAGVDPKDLDLVELHDCFATAELIHYDNLGLCERGGAGEFIDSGAPFRDGTTPVNVSGGLHLEGAPDRRHRRRQRLRGRHPSPRRGRRSSDQGCEGRPGPRDRARLGVWCPRAREVGSVRTDVTRERFVAGTVRPLRGVGPCPSRVRRAAGRPRSGGGRSGGGGDRSSARIRRLARRPSPCRRVGPRRPRGVARARRIRTRRRHLARTGGARGAGDHRRAWSWAAPPPPSACSWPWRG